MYPSKEKRMDWMCVLRVPNNLLHTKTLTDDLILQICELLLENFSHFAFSISFPEFVFPSIVLLKKFIKNSKVSTYRKPLKELVLYVCFLFILFLFLFYFLFIYYYYYSFSL